MSQILVSMFKNSPRIRNYQRTLLHRELLKKTNKCPPTSVHTPELRRVSFYADNEFLEKPQWSSVATYDTRSYADSDPYIGILEIKSRAQVEAEELQAWADLKAKTSSTAWKPKARSPGPRLTSRQRDEQDAFAELCFAPLDISNLHTI